MTALAPRHRPGSSTVAALVDAALDGDERAWEEICERHLSQVRAVAHARLRDEHAADDVVQETFLRAWTRLHQVRDAAGLGSWLKTIAANVAVDHVRRQRTMAPLDAASRTPDPAPSHDEVVVANEEAEVLHRHLAELREVDRHALWQRDGHGVPVGELANELGMTAGSVRVLLTRARSRVREGYDVLAAPVVAGIARWRHRLAGLGDAVPVAVATPAVVVAVVAGVAAPALQSEAPVEPAASVAVAPSPSASLTPDGAEDTPPPREAPRPTPAAPDPPSPIATPEASSDGSDTAPRVDIADGSAGFTDEAPTDEDSDARAPTPAGPVEALEVYLDESELPGIGQVCVLCD